jgi:chromosome segregation ATPase
MLEGMEERGDAYTPTEAARILARTDKPITERRIRQMLQAGELEGFRDEAGRWHVLQSEVHRLRDERRIGSQEPPGGPQSGVELLEVVRALERERGRLEGRLELTERTESTTRAERDRLIAELEAERAERRRLAEQLEAERARAERGFWSRLFGG